MTSQEKMILRFLLTVFVVGVVIGFVRREWFGTSPQLSAEAEETSIAIASIAASNRDRYEASLTSEDGEGKNQIISAMVKVNINTAALEELVLLPGIGPALAEKIIIYRQDYGNFKSIEELKKVRGIGEKSLQRLGNLITI